MEQISKQKGTGQSVGKGGKDFDISFSPFFLFLPPWAPQRSIVCEVYKLGKAPSTAGVEWCIVVGWSSVPWWPRAGVGSLPISSMEYSK